VFNVQYHFFFFCGHWKHWQHPVTRAWWRVCSYCGTSSFSLALHLLLYKCVYAHMCVAIAINYMLVLFTHSGLIDIRLYKRLWTESVMNTGRIWLAHDDSIFPLFHPLERGHPCLMR
jgi:hypothetical protein